MFAQLIAAMAHHGYLNLEGGQRLVEFIVKQCAVNVDEEVMLLLVKMFSVNMIAYIASPKLNSSIGS
jgi:hypothetical protein